MGSTGTQPPLLQVPSLPQLFSKWNTSASSPRPSSSSPPLSWPCPVLGSSRSLEASVHSFPQSMPTPTRALRTPARVSVSEQWERLLLATVSSARTVTSPSGQALVLLLTPMDRSFPSLG